jgi:hypothetical protein
MLTTSEFNNISFEEKLKSYLSNYSTLAYVIEKNDDTDEGAFFELDIISTSLSELEGSEEGILESFTYLDEEEAQQDIDTATQIFKTEFSKL